MSRILNATASISDDTPIKFRDMDAIPGTMLSFGAADLIVFLTPVAEARLREMLNIRAGQRIQASRPMAEPVMTADDAMKLLDRLGQEIARDEAIQSGKVARLHTRPRGLPTDADCDAIIPASCRLFGSDALTGFPSINTELPSDTEAPSDQPPRRA